MRDEQYAGVAYGLSVGASLVGPWFQASGGQRLAFHSHCDKQVR